MKQEGYQDEPCPNCERWRLWNDGEKTVCDNCQWNPNTADYAWPEQPDPYLGWRGTIFCPGEEDNVR